MATSDVHMEGEEHEYVVLDLDSVSSQVHIPPNAPYVLSIGEYDETIGTCIVLSEHDAPPVIHEETGPSETNLFAGKSIIDPNQVPKRQIKPVCQVQKILRFKLLSEELQTDIVQDLTIEPRTINRN